MRRPKHDRSNFAEIEMKERKKSKKDSIIGGQNLETLLASTSLIGPLVALTAVLIGLVIDRRMSDNNSTYSLDNHTALPLGTAYFVNCSSTTLVYIASLSSTLATLLIGPAMLLFSFSLARDIGKNSDEGAISKLPSPYQLELLIRLIDGKLMVLWSYLLYICGRRGRRINIVPVLWHACSMLVALVLLAILTSLADLWLHLGTKSVLYLELRPEQLTPDLNPGRALHPSCLDGSGDYRAPKACIIRRGDAVKTPTLVNRTEFVMTATNYSKINQIYMSDGFTLLGPSNPPIDLDFQADTFGSQTSCRPVTGLCGANNTKGVRRDKPSDYNFACNASVAGLNMTGNFLRVLAPATGDSIELNVTDGSDGQKVEDGFSPAFFVLGGNTIARNTYAIGFQYFHDRQKLLQRETPDSYYGLSWDDAKDSHLHWAVVWRTDFDSSFASYGEGDNNPNDVSAVGIMNGGSQGILSCDTNIYELTYAFVNNSMRIVSSRTPRTNASIPFKVGITASWSYQQLQSGVGNSFVAADSSADFAARFAAIFDQTLLSIPAGVMQSRPPLNVSRRVTTQVTRVPRPPFVLLVLLNLLHALVSIVLTASAVMAIAKGRGVRDAQVRLSLAAIVAERFENPALGDDAREIDELYAERRGLATRKVTLQRRNEGGRRYGLVVDQGTGEESIPLQSTR
ncbi:hypothetical protein EPUS_04759 [Endocarpon pusillum Z07020]|uniref:Uncharacterized protein n=1 Tax=Endocarpon pusillum (strain Z07020 / HMAS-L-300199) TaxID=1263415 RepID=U1GLF6_ENDPU|nr:uncharacterized protein EPUS_04759 [Endocarpon pusillum Z07020]ERF72706.1 hypothetical protein EPUS_04759 [Endocarpon pusillum Z07020]